MSAFFGSPHMVDLVLVVLLVETLALVFLRSAVTSWINIAAAALPGLFLLLALRAALAGGGWVWVALWLAASFPAHLFDLWRRPP
jgi:hypothetical protein